MDLLNYECEPPVNPPPGIVEGNDPRVHFALIQSGTKEASYAGLHYLMPLLSLEGKVNETLTNCSGILFYLMDRATMGPFDGVRVMASYCLTIMSAEADEEELFHAIPIFVDYLKPREYPPKDTRITIMGMRFLANIACRSRLGTDHVRNAGIEHELLSILRKEHCTLPLKIEGTRLLAYLYKWPPHPQLSETRRAIWVLSKILHAKNDRVLIQCSKLMIYLSTRNTPALNNLVVDCMKENQVLDRIPSLLDSNYVAQNYTLQVICSIVENNVERKRFIIGLHVLEKLPTLLQDPTLHTLVCQLVHLLADTNIQELPTNLMASMVKLLKDSPFIIVKKASSRAIRTLSASGAHRYLLAMGAIKALCNNLEVGGADLSLNCICSLENILKLNEDTLRGAVIRLIQEENGVDRIRRLRSNRKIELAETARDIDRRYLGGR